MKYGWDDNVTLDVCINGQTRLRSVLAKGGARYLWGKIRKIDLRWFGELKRRPRNMPSRRCE